MEFEADNDILNDASTSRPSTLCGGGQHPTVKPAMLYRQRRGLRFFRGSVVIKQQVEELT